MYMEIDKTITVDNLVELLERFGEEMWFVSSESYNLDAVRIWNELIGLTGELSDYSVFQWLREIENIFGNQGYNISWGDATYNTISVCFKGVYYTLEVMISQDSIRLYFTD